MAFWNVERGVDDFVRRTDNSLNLLVVVLLAAFALGTGAYYYGQMHPKGPVASQVSPNSNATSPAPLAQPDADKSK
jgi:uncharacterized protein HemX